MKTVIGISLGARSQDFDFSTRFLGVDLRVRRIGTGGSTAQAAKLVRQWDKKADAIGLGLVKDSGRVGARRQRDADAARLARLATRAPVSTGAQLIWKV